MFDHDFSERCEASSERALGYLLRAQLSSGEFTTLEAAGVPIAAGSAVKSVFITALILKLLRELPERPSSKEAIETIANRAGRFLLDEQHSSGLWRFFGEQDRRFPPDVDSTACTTIALLKWGKQLDWQRITGAMRKYRRPDGAYFTWMMDEAEYTWKLVNDVDHVVTLNVARCFHALGIRDHDARIYLERVVANGEFGRGTVYYPMPLVFVYFSSVAYRDTAGWLMARNAWRLIRAVKEARQVDAASATDLELGLAIAALANFAAIEPNVRGWVERLLEGQLPDGSWPAAALFQSPAQEQYGSPEMTTAIAAGAIARWASQQRVGQESS